MTSNPNLVPDKKNDSNPANRDPITGTPGAHPVGTGLGAAGGGAAGAAIGAVAGPIGAVAGAVVGAVVGGLGGKAAAEAIDPTVQDAYWEENFSKRPYVNPQQQYKDLQPAYRFGWENASRSQGKSFEDLAPSMEREWTASPSSSSLAWNSAKPAVRDAWDRVSPNRK